ncbi:hypothetical protein ACTWPV_44415, partial [Nonomuraea sp. KM88]
GLGILLGGLLVEAAGPEHGLAIAGAAGLVAGVPVLLAWNRATKASPGPRDHDARAAPGPRQQPR